MDVRPLRLRGRASRPQLKRDSLDGTLTWFLGDMRLVRSRPAVAAGGSPPREPPSGPPGREPPGGQTPGRFWGSRAGHAVLLFMLLLSALGVPAAVAGMVYGSVRRPLSAGLASVAVLLAAFLNRRITVADTDTYCGRLLGAGIAGGIVGEGLTYLVFSLPPNAPTSATWVLVFLLGIGGAVGVGAGLAGFILSAGLIAARFIPPTARVVFRRAA
jgi:hypothetical protein